MPDLVKATQLRPAHGFRHCYFKDFTATLLSLPDIPHRLPHAVADVWAHSVSTLLWRVLVARMVCISDRVRALRYALRASPLHIAEPVSSSQGNASLSAVSNAMGESANNIL